LLHSTKVRFTCERGRRLAATDLAIRTSEPPRFSLLARVRVVYAAREILANLTRKEVMVKYKSSVLGAMWTMLNPVLYLAVFSLVFKVVLRSQIPHFPVYLLSGLLAWTLFSTAAALGVRSIVDNSNLVTKVYFPREVLPFASVGAAFTDFLFQSLVLVAVMAILRVGHFGLNLLLLPLSVFTLLALAAALALWASALNVRYRDTQHLLTLALLLWFWMTPVVYPSALVFQEFADRSVVGIPALYLYLANPLAAVVMGFQRALYGVVAPGGEAVLMPVSLAWLAVVLGAVALGSVALLALAWRTFFRLSGDFAEEL
jgi:ABC-2 type transport system permease protein